MGFRFIAVFRMAVLYYINPLLKSTFVLLCDFLVHFVVKKLTTKFTKQALRSLSPDLS